MANKRKSAGEVVRPVTGVAIRSYLYDRLVTMAKAAGVSPADFASAHLSNAIECLAGEDDVEQGPREVERQAGAGEPGQED